jgi:hypothetical protein
MTGSANSSVAASVGRNDADVLGELDRRCDVLTKELSELIRAHRHLLNTEFFATSAAPIEPPPPGLFSMTIVWPICFAISSSTTRATTSLALPAVKGLIIVIVRVGQACAKAVDVPVVSAAPMMAAYIMRDDVMCSSEWCRSS